MKRLLVSNAAIALLLFTANAANAEVLCSRADVIPPGVSTAVSTAVDLIGVIPEDEKPALVSGITKIGSGLVLVEALNALCADVIDKDWVPAYLKALPLIASLAGAEVAPLVSVTADLAGRVVDATRQVVANAGLAHLNSPDSMNYNVAIEKYARFWLNSPLTPSDISNHVVSMQLVALNGAKSESYELTTDVAPSTYNDKPKLTAGTGAGADPIADSCSGCQLFFRVQFKNKQWFLIPIDASSISITSADVTASFLLKNGRYYYK
jgi:hypothetical protein